MSHDNLLVLVGGCSVIFMLYRINLVLAQEFPDEDAFVKHPLDYAVRPTVDFNEFKENS